MCTQLAPARQCTRFYSVPNLHTHALTANVSAKAGHGMCLWTHQVPHQLSTPISTLHPLATHSSGGLPTSALARMLPDEATMNVITHEATGCLNANWILPTHHTWEKNYNTCNWLRYTLFTWLPPQCKCSQYEVDGAEEREDWERVVV